MSRHCRLSCCRRRSPPLLADGHLEHRPRHSHTHLPVLPGQPGLHTRRPHVSCDAGQAGAAGCHPPSPGMAAWVQLDFSAACPCRPGMPACGHCPAAQPLHTSPINAPQPNLTAPSPPCMCSTQVADMAGGILDEVARGGGTLCFTARPDKVTEARSHWLVYTQCSACCFVIDHTNRSWPCPACPLLFPHISCHLSTCCMHQQRLRPMPWSSSRPGSVLKPHTPHPQRLRRWP